MLITIMECHYADCHNAERHYAECCYPECRGADFLPIECAMKNKSAKKERKSEHCNKTFCGRNKFRTIIS